MKIKIWGARGSIPTPISSRELREKMIAVLENARDVDLDDPIAVRDYLDGLHPLVAGTAGGDTACIEIQTDGKTIILDAGTGIRALGQSLMAGPCGRGEGVIHLFFSHTHWDHIQGLPFFLPIYVPGNQIFIYAIHPVETSLRDQMKPANFPIALENLAATLKFVSLKPQQSLQLGSISINTMRLHHPGDAYAFRFEHQGAVFVYATDVECKQIDSESLQPYINFFVDADALIFDSQFTLRESLVKADWGHSSALIGAEIARRAKVKRLILFHHDPTTSDTELLKILEETRTAQAKYETEPSTEVLVGRESLVIDLTPPQPFAIIPRFLPKTAIATITEDFDQQAARELVAQLTTEQGLQELPRLIVDLSAIQQLYIAGLRSLIDLRDVWKGQPMALAAVSKQAQEIMELTNCADLFAIFPTVKNAQDALDAQETFRLPGQLLKDRYRIEAKIRENDIGTVFKAADTRLDRQVALMILSPTLSQATSRRLLQQALKTAHLQTSNIITMFDADEDHGLIYLILEYTEAQTLRSLTDAGISPPLIQLALSITEALDYAHNNGVIHGNLNPGNILVGDTIKLTDFGLSLLEEGQHLADNPVLTSASRYLAPEQIEGRPVDARTDLYALGIILYQLSTGQLPFSDSEHVRMEQLLAQKFVSPRQFNPKLSRSLEHLIMKLLSKNAEQRYQSASQVLQVLSSLNQHSFASPGNVAQTNPLFRQAQGDLEVLTPELIPQHQGELIGRETEVKQILKLWSVAQVGRGQTLLIGGEAGIGKTRLAEEIEHKVLPGLTLLGRCSEFEGNPPYQPFVEIVRHYIAQTPLDTLRQEAENSVAISSFMSTLAPLVPDLYDIVPNLQPAVPLDPEQAETRMKSNLLRFIEQATSDRPWMIVLDDLHWSDPSSLQLFYYLARNVEDLPLLIVGTYRDVELDADHPMREMMETLSRLPTYHHLSLNRLTQNRVGQLLESLWQQRVPSTWVAAIYERAGGNPFYVKEVAKALVEEGAIEFKDGEWHFAKVGELKLPPKIRDIVLRRIHRVDAKTQEVLRIAAVLGQQFAFDDLLATVSQAEDELLSCLDEAMSHNLLREVDSGTMLGFSNIEIQQVIYEDLSNLRRIRLHQQVGTTLEAFYGQTLAPVAGRLAYHFLQANNQTQAFVYSLKAGRHAQSVYAYETALRWYTQAVDLLPPQPAFTTDHLTLYQGLGDMLQMQTRFGEAAKAYRTMADIAELLDNQVAQVQALHAISATQNAQGDYQAALETAQATEKAARNAKAQTILARSLYEQGWALLNLGQTNKALKVGEKVLTFSTTLDATYEIGQSLDLVAAAHGALGHYQKASEYQQQALTLYRNLGNRNRISAMLNNLGESYYLQEDYKSAASLYQEALEIARDTGDRTSEILYLTNLGGTYLRQGRHTQAEAILLQVIQMPETIRSTNLADTYRRLAEVRLGLKKNTQALTEAQLALALAKEAAPETLGIAWRTLGRVIAQQPNPISIDERIYAPTDCFSESLRIFNNINRPGEQIRTLQAWAAYEELQGNLQKAAKLRQDTRTLARKINSS